MTPTVQKRSTVSRGKVWPLQTAPPMPPRVGQRGASSPQDRDWHDTFEVQVEPNPELSSSQREAVARECDMPKGQVSLYVRRALLYKLRKRLSLDVDHEPASEKPVVIANRIEFGMALATADCLPREVAS